MRFDQYEVWAIRARGGTWELVATFTDFDVASAVARNYSYRMRLVHAVYENGKAVKRDVLAEIAGTREEP